MLDFFAKGVYVSFRCRRCSSVVEHVIGNDGVASPILASGTIKKASFREAFLMVIVGRAELRSKSDEAGWRPSIGEGRGAKATRS